MLFTMRPLVLESDGLAAALQAMADKMRDTYQQNVEIQADPAVIDRLDNTRQTAVFYLAEEAVNNARKHARASRILVQLGNLSNDCEVALLEIADNGVGFDPQAVGANYERRGSLGMVNLRERTELVEGLLNIDSAPGRGTRVQVLIPLSPQAADRLQRGLIGVPAN
jgi:signal transduction histidine kinase